MQHVNGMRLISVPRLSQALGVLFYEMLTGDPPFSGRPLGLLIEPSQAAFVVYFFNVFLDVFGWF